MSATESTWRGPLTGIRVLDLSRVLAGPYATMMLADMGADVIKIEDLGSGDGTRQNPPFLKGESTHFMNINRNKRSIAIDLKNPAGREQFLDLVKVSDIVVENFRAGVLERLRLHYPILREVNPRIILCSISGFGQNSSYQNRPTYDVITQALSGAMSVTGEPGGAPVRLGIPMGDLGGGLFGCIGILGALQERNVTGQGQSIDVSMLDALVHLMIYYPVDYLNVGEIPGPVGGRHHHVVPYGVLKVKDGHVVVAVLEARFWRPFCDALERPDLATNPLFAESADRLKNRTALYDLLEEIMTERTRSEWEARFLEAGVPHAPILTVDQVVAHPLMAEREMFVTVEHPVAGPIKVVGRPIKFPQRQFPAFVPAPLQGQDTRAVLTEIAGTPLERVMELERSGVVRQAEMPAARSS